MRPRDDHSVPLHLQTDNQRLFHRLDTLCKDLHANDTLIGEALSKLHRMEQIESELSVESQLKASDEVGAQEQINRCIQETIGEFVHSLNVIEVES